MFRLFFFCVLSLAVTASISHAAQESPVTRAEAAMFLFVQSKSAVPPSRSAFPDVPAGTWQERYLRAAVQRGMVKPDERTGAIHPDQPVTRGEYLSMLAALYALPSGNFSSFTDIPPSAPFARYASHAENCKLFSTGKTKRMEPSRPLDHAEASLALFALWRCFPSTKPAAAIEQGMMPAKFPKTTVASSKATLQSPLLTPNKTEQRKVQIIALVNQERTQSGLKPLIRNPLLEQAAQAHAKDMYKRGYFSHFTPEGLSYVDRIRLNGYLTLPSELCPCQAIFDMSSLLQNSESKPHFVITQRSKVCNCTPRYAVGENIARGQPTPMISVQQWMASESHRQTIMQPLFRETGVGVYGDVWVQEFGMLSLE